MKRLLHEIYGLHKDIFNIRIGISIHTLQFFGQVDI